MLMLSICVGVEFFRQRELSFSSFNPEDTFRLEARRMLLLCCRDGEREVDGEDRETATASREVVRLRPREQNTRGKVSGSIFEPTGRRNADDLFSLKHIIRVKHSGYATNRNPIETVPVSGE